MIEGLRGDTEFFVGFASRSRSRSHGFGGKGSSGVNQDIPLPCGLGLNAPSLVEAKLYMKYMSKVLIPAVIKDITQPFTR